MQPIVVPRSKTKTKKYAAKVNGRTVNFGALGYDDYTTHRDEKRKRSYIARHKKRENWNDLKTAGAWSKHLLWNETTLAASAKSMEHRFGVRIVLRL